MAQSLLGSLYTHIRGSQEDIATLSMHYLISNSAVVREAFNEYVGRTLETEIPGATHYICQATGEKQERPDMAGAADGKEIVLIESKFYAALTENQPVTYIERLRKEGGKGLLFIVPERRKRALWHEIREQFTFPVENVNDFCCEFSGVKLGITSWESLLDYLDYLVSVKAPEFKADLHQLVGFYKEIEDTAFIPLQPEDLGQDVARNFERFFSIIDATYEALRSDSTLNFEKRSQTNSYRMGYWTGLRLDGFDLGINFSIDRWKETSSVSTPFWLSIGSPDGSKDDLIMQFYTKKLRPEHISSLWGLNLNALFPKTNATLEEVAKDMKRQIVEHVRRIEELGV